MHYSKEIYRTSLIIVYSLVIKKNFLSWRTNSSILHIYSRNCILYSLCHKHRQIFEENTQVVPRKKQPQLFGLTDRFGLFSC